MNAAFALSLAYSGFVGLWLAMQRHQRLVWTGHPTPMKRTVLRSMGWLCLALSLVFCIRTWGVATGVVGWFGMLTAAGLTVAFLLPFALRAATAARDRISCGSR